MTEQTAGRRTLVVTAVDDGTPGIRTLVMAPADGLELASFTPGSHIVLDCGGTSNAYSLTGPASSPDSYRISVQLQDGGSGSAWVHRQLSAGSLVQSSQPRSLFAPVSSGRHHVLVAGGIGVTPLLSHAQAAVRWGRSFEFIYAAAPGRAAYLEELRELCRERLTVAGSRAVLMDTLRSRLADCPIGTYLYFCGPSGMMAAVEELALGLGWPAERVRQERFTAALDEGEPFRMRIASAGRVLDVPAGASALDVLERAGVYVPRMCRQGICGECRVEVSSGEVIHRDIYLDDAEKQSNTAMMCCVSRAAGEVVLDV